MHTTEGKKDIEKGGVKIGKINLKAKHNHNHNHNDQYTINNKQ